ncbi:MAG: DHHW family protein, partial [bacterium]|nr:DHHW family protein [bacterium]MDY4099390.1 DHHW family protein [Lachnospiraceae bacterium]
AAGGASIFLLPQKAYSAAENRYLTKLPRISADGILTGEVQRDLTEAASDQFPGRDLWMQVATTGQYLLYHREINGVYIGKEGHLFEKVIGSDLSEKNYETNLRYITAMKNTTEADVSVMLIPSPGTVLKEKLPTRAVLYDPAVYESRGEQLCETESVRWIQTKDALTRAARERFDEIYFKTDHHWTTNGAYVGAKTYLETQHVQIKEQESYQVAAANEEFYGTLYAKVAGLPGAHADELELPQLLPQNLIIEADHPPADALGTDGEKEMPRLTGIYDLSKLDMKDKYAVYFGGNYGKITIKNHQAEGKGSLLIIKDSYANSMVPYLLDSYEQITMIDLRYYNESVPELVAEGWDEVLVCYEMTNFIKDRNLFKLIR